MRWWTIGRRWPLRVLMLMAAVAVLSFGPVEFGGVVPVGGPAAALAADEAKAEAVKDPAEGTIINGKTVFFGCASGLAVGALLTAFPPLANWALMAGALPSVVAVSVFSGVGCSFGLFGGVFVATVGWVFDKVGQAFWFIF